MLSTSPVPASPEEPHTWVQNNLGPNFPLETPPEPVAASAQLCALGACLGCSPGAVAPPPEVKAGPGWSRPGRGTLVQTGGGWERSPTAQVSMVPLMAGSPVGSRSGILNLDTGSPKQPGRGVELKQVWAEGALALVGRVPFLGVRGRHPDPPNLSLLPGIAWLGCLLRVLAHWLERRAPQGPGARPTHHHPPSVPPPGSWGAPFFPR